MLKNRFNPVFWHREKQWRDMNRKHQKRKQKSQTIRSSTRRRKKNSRYNFARTHGVRRESIGEKAILLMEAQWKRKLNQAHESPWFLRLTTVHSTLEILWQNSYYLRRKYENGLIVGLCRTNYRYERYIVGRVVISGETPHWPQSAEILLNNLCNFSYAILI